MLSRFETKEHAYEEEAVTVYARMQDWYLVGLRDGGRAWLNTHQTGRYFPVEELVVNRNNYLTQQRSRNRCQGAFIPGPPGSETSLAAANKSAHATGGWRGLYPERSISSQVITRLVSTAIRPSSDVRVLSAASTVLFSGLPATMRSRKRSTAS